jgi:hypothetical protein
MKRNLKNQRGALLISAIVLIVIVAFLASFVSYMTTTNKESTINQIDSEQAFYIAQAGMARAKYKLITSNFSDKIGCDQITGDSDLTNIAFGNGQFTVTGTELSPSTIPTLTSSINAVATTIPVSSVSELTPGGRVMIDYELLDYASTSTSAASCGGTAPCLLGVTRGVGGSNNVAHQNGADITQDECQIVANGYIPNSSSPVAHRQVTALMVQLGDGWITGDQQSGEFFAQWNGAFWNRFPVSGGIPNKHMNGIVSVGRNDVWAVGARSGGSALFTYWNGSTWARVLPAASVANKDLYAISCIASNDCWAVGNSRTFAYWNGAIWQGGNVKTNGNINSGKVPNKHIRSVSCVNGSDCWAVGDDEGGEALIVDWDGSQWKRVVPAVSVPNKDLDGVYCTASNNCWAVGQREGGDGLFVHWDGSAWSRVIPTSSSNKNFNAVTCVDANDCFAVGQSGYIFHWDGTNWTSMSSGTSTELKAVNCAASDNCWAVGNSRIVLRWNGTAWETISTSNLPNTTLRGVVGITGEAGSDAIRYWQEI